MSIVVWMIVFAFVASSPVDRISGQAPNRLSGESTSPEEQYVLGRTSGIEFPSHSGIFIEDLCTPRAAPRRDQRDSRLDGIDFLSKRVVLLSVVWAHLTHFAAKKVNISTGSSPISGESRFVSAALPTANSAVPSIAAAVTTSDSSTEFSTHQTLSATSKTQVSTTVSIQSSPTPALLSVTNFSSIVFVHSSTSTPTPTPTSSSSTLVSGKLGVSDKIALGIGIPGVVVAIFGAYSTYKAFKAYKQRKP
ncbi:hypothetical protein V8E51_008367 [Hyaloscypha variabilis]